MVFKISNLMIALVLISAIITIFGLFIAEGSATYNVTYDNSSLGVYNRVQTINNLTQRIDAQTSEIKQPSGLLDIIGGFFTSAYQVLLLTKESVGIGIDVAEGGVNQLNIGASGSVIKTAITTILLITVFVSIILAVLLKWEI